MKSTKWYFGIGYLDRSREDDPPEGLSPRRGGRPSTPHDPESDAGGSLSYW
jgi:hypothetical protein